jgi:alpha-tubulin suppressor-like RCC1 family protein
LTSNKAEKTQEKATQEKAVRMASEAIKTKKEPETIIFSSGKNDKGQLGTGGKLAEKKERLNNLTFIERVLLPQGILIEQISCGGNFSMALDSKGQVYSWGEGGLGALGTGRNNDEFTPVKVKFDDDNRKIKYLSAGFCHAMAIADDNSIYSWGLGSEGQLGLG